MIDNKGQISAEFLFLFGVLILVVMLSIVFVSHESELNIAMAAARSGAIEGASSSSAAIYPADTFRDYSYSKTGLLHPYSVDIINVSYNELGHDINYDKKKNSV